MWKRPFLFACWEGEIEEQGLKPARHIHFHLKNDITTPYVHLGQRDGGMKGSRKGRGSGGGGGKEEREQESMVNGEEKEINGRKRLLKKNK